MGEPVSEEQNREGQAGEGRPASEEIVLGGGCFWCVEAVYRLMKGVEAVEPGYAGGHVPHPSYEQVCSGRTGHAEVIRIRFDPREVSLRELLRVFFTVHDPTTKDRQGADVGPQYRSIILYRDPEQRAAAEEVKHEVEAEGIWEAPIVTEIAPLDAFHPAEEAHREYFERNPRQPYCSVVIAPKVAKFRAQYRDRLKAG